MIAWTMRRLLRAHRRGALYPCAECRHSGHRIRVSQKTALLLAKHARAMGEHCIGCAIAALVRP